MKIKKVICLFFGHLPGYEPVEDRTIGEWGVKCYQCGKVLREPRAYPEQATPPDPWEAGLRALRESVACDCAGIPNDSPDIPLACHAPSCAKRIAVRDARPPAPGWEMLCEHANDVPKVCPCKPYCGCKYYHCRPKVVKRQYPDV